MAFPCQVVLEDISTTWSRVFLTLSCLGTEMHLVFSESTWTGTPGLIKILSVLTKSIIWTYNLHVTGQFCVSLLAESSIFLCHPYAFKIFCLYKFAFSFTESVAEIIVLLLIKINAFDCHQGAAKSL